MISTPKLLSDAAEKTAKALGNKKKKELSGNALTMFVNSVKREVKNGLKVMDHFSDRVVQRFEDSEEDILAQAISRALRATAPKEGHSGAHMRVSHKYIDEATGIVVVLERMGRLGANLVTTYKVGEESLISDDELRELKRKGIA